jgi:pimeloyl-ACP methyl ester carboxylesterase
VFFALQQCVGNEAARVRFAHRLDSAEGCAKAHLPAVREKGRLMFQGFEIRDIPTSETTIRLRVGGSGPRLLLLHGYLQTHVMWHRVAPALAAR